jgi:hypothetical protein
MCRVPNPALDDVQLAVLTRLSRRGYGEPMTNQTRTVSRITEPLRADFGAIAMTSEAEDVRAIIEYLGLAQSSPEAQRITGLGKSAISEVLSGHRVGNTNRRTHIAIVAAIVRRLSSGRETATGSAERGKSAIGWLYTARVETSSGARSPLDVLSDTSLALESLGGLER